MSYKLYNINEIPQRKEDACAWFSSKFGIPYSAYMKNMDDCLRGEKAVPQWYVAIENDRIIGGLGVIENDFHMRVDLTPNVCAVYVEEDRRCRGIAREMLQYVCEDMERRGIKTLYLVTDHTSFYERCGWKFFCMVKEEGFEHERRMYVHTQTENDVRTP